MILLLRHSVHDRHPHTSIFFFFNDTATTEIYTLSLQRRSSDLILTANNSKMGKDTLSKRLTDLKPHRNRIFSLEPIQYSISRSEEHTSELQSPDHLVCRLLLEKKNTTDRSLVLVCVLVHTNATA